MKNPFKHENTPKGKPSKPRVRPKPSPSRDLTDADLELVQGGKGTTNLQKLCCTGKHFQEATIVV